MVWLLFYVRFIYELGDWSLIPKMRKPGLSEETKVRLKSGWLQSPAFSPSQMAVRVIQATGLSSSELTPHRTVLTLHARMPCSDLLVTDARADSEGHTPILLELVGVSSVPAFGSPTDSQH